MNIVFYFLIPLIVIFLLAITLQKAYDSVVKNRPNVNCSKIDNGDVVLDNIIDDKLILTNLD